MKRKVILAESAGFCFGVQRAVDQTVKIQKDYGKKIYTLGPLIHNNDVVKYLENNDVFSISIDNIDELSKGDAVIIRSHGVSKAVMDLLESKGIITIDATCPFVTNIQKKVNKYSKEGYQIVILGDKDHPEVIGINGWCDNKAIITKDGELPERIPNKICVVSQTTEKEENWVNTIRNLSVRTKELLAFNTICAATEIRQKGVFELSKTVDLMIVVGGKNSSNTTKLYQIAKMNCKRAIHIENSSELSTEIINDSTINKIGITAGASTPDWIINEVVELMEGDI
ncbi:4-hydroxy-3-methylbut-2-enyl diphosphate reductase IspH [Clostridium disporicum]|uniref:4-hydroxy-3-methylbut-2-enyl diphosphate reductase n=1 Tax=Clostridium disporicum TaxID=84024 RepID=A0A173Y3Y6_9CLOT|nr:4-hydroxy-3-methylbut-2-enyl diphosphate reductase IspH [Clostridium disporicum]